MSQINLIDKQLPSNQGRLLAVRETPSRSRPVRKESARCNWFLLRATTFRWNSGCGCFAVCRSGSRTVFWPYTTAGRMSRAAKPSWRSVTYTFQEGDAVNPVSCRENVRHAHDPLAHPAGRGPLIRPSS